MNSTPDSNTNTDINTGTPTTSYQDILFKHEQMLLSIYTSSLTLSHNTKDFMYKYQSFLLSLKKLIMSCPISVVQEKLFHILKQLFILVVYSRDSFGGLGRRDLTNKMLFIWNYHFPVPTAKLIQSIVIPIQDNPPFGSWRDIKSLCLHVRNFSDKKELDPFIDTCIGLMNHQLDMDNTRWNEALDKYNRKKNTPWEIPYPHPSTVGISLVSKWIPRESSSFGWLFQLCAIQYIRSFKPQYFQHISNKDSPSRSTQFQKALRKGKQEYRNIFVRLSKAWDTLQIKQCSRQWGSIQPEHITMNSMVSQQQALLNINSSGNPRKNTFQDKSRNHCAMKIQCFWKTHRSNHPVFVPMNTFTRKAIRLHSTVERNRLGNLWKRVLSQIGEMPFIFPILDLSLFASQPETFYSYLSMALALSCKSTLFGKEKRLLCFDAKTHFVDIGTDSSIFSLLDIMKPIYHQHHAGSNVEHACTVLIECIQNSQLRENDFSNLVLVLFSSYSLESYQKVVLLFTNAGLLVPTILWSAGDVLFGSYFGSDGSNDDGSNGDGSNGGDDDPFNNPNNHFIPNMGAIPLVGTHNHILSQISHIELSVWKHLSPYQFLSSLLENKRYSTVEQYFNTLLQNKK